MAGGKVAGSYLAENRGRFFAGCLGPLAAVGKRTAGERYPAGSDAAGNAVGGVVPAEMWIGDRNGTQQHPGVGVDGVADKFTGIGEFYETPCVHYGDTAGNMADHCQIMGNKEITEASFLLKTFQKVNDLALIGKIQGGDNFITYDEFRTQRHGAGYAHTLLLTA